MKGGYFEGGLVCDGAEVIVLGNVRPPQTDKILVNKF